MKPNLITCPVCNGFGGGEHSLVGTVNVPNPNGSTKVVENIVRCTGCDNLGTLTTVEAINRGLIESPIARLRREAEETEASKVPSNVITLKEVA